MLLPSAYAQDKAPAPNQSSQGPGQGQAGAAPTQPEPSNSAVVQPVPKPPPPPVPQSLDAPRKALTLYDEAQALYQRGLYAQAIQKLERAVDLDPKAIELHYNLGLIHEKMGHLKEALGSFRTCLTLENNPLEKVRLERTVARIEGALRQQQAPTPSPHLEPVPVPVPEPRTGPRSAAPHPAVLVLSGVSAAGLIVGAGLAVYAGDRDPGRTPTTRPGTSFEDLQADAQAAHDVAIGADVAFGVGIAAGVTALTLAIALPLVASDDEPEDAERTDQANHHQPRLYLGAGSARLAVSF